MGLLTLLVALVACGWVRKPPPRLLKTQIDEEDELYGARPSLAFKIRSIFIKPRPYPTMKMIMGFCLYRNDVLIDV